jgi:hypothetical protein
MKKIPFGRHVFGLAAVFFGLLTLAWHDFNGWQQIRVLSKFSHPAILANIAGAVELFGGIAIQWRRTARAGAIALGAIYSIFLLLWVPLIIAQPLVYDPWGNFFEQLSQVSGALIVYACFDHERFSDERSDRNDSRRDDSHRSAKLARIGYIAFGVCVISFTLEQLIYLSGTASFVPKWFPPGQMFWAITTTIAFALAAIALLSERSALLASRLTTAMIVGFGLFVWLPALFTKPFADSHVNWAGNAENLSIAGAAWIVADFLGTKNRPAEKVELIAA